MDDQMTPEQRAALDAARARLQAGETTPPPVTQGGRRSFENYTPQELETAARRAEAANDPDSANRLRAASIIATRRQGQSHAMTGGLADLSAATRNPQVAQNIEVALPDGRVVDFPPGTSRETMQAAIKGFLSNEQPQAPQPPQDGNRAAQTLDTRQAERTLRQRIGDNIFGYDDGVYSPGERIAAALNNGGEAMTVGLIGDEVQGQIDGFFGRRGMDAAGNTEFYRRQQEQLFDEAPTLGILSEVGGAMLGPGLGMGAAARGAANGVSAVGRAAAGGGILGGIYGAMEGEGGQGRALGAATGAAGGILGGAVASTAVTGINAGLRAAAGTQGGQGIARGMATLKDSAQRLYDTALSTGGPTVPQNAIRALRSGVDKTLKDAGYNARLHPRISAALGELETVAQGPQPLARLEQTRRVLSNAAQSNEADERRLASMVLGKMDEFMDGQGGGPDLAAAREMWSRLRRVETVGQIIENASNATNFATTLQSGFRTLLRSDKRMRGFSAAERGAITDLARGGSRAVQGLEALGKLTSLQSLPGIAGAGGLGATLGPLAGAAMPLGGILGRRVGQAGLRDQAQNLQRGILGEAMPQTRQITPEAGGILNALAAHMTGREVHNALAQ